jgi:hypothetical protein
MLELCRLLREKSVSQGRMLILYLDPYGSATMQSIVSYGNLTTPFFGLYFRLANFESRQILSSTFVSGRHQHNIDTLLATIRVLSPFPPTFPSSTEGYFFILPFLNKFVGQNQMQKQDYNLCHIILN